MIMHGGATTFSVMTHSNMTLVIKRLFATLSIKMTLSIMNGT